MTPISRDGSGANSSGATIVHAESVNYLSRRGSQKENKMAVQSGADQIPAEPVKPTQEHFVVLKPMH